MTIHAVITVSLLNQYDVTANRKQNCSTYLKKNYCVWRHTFFDCAHIYRMLPVKPQEEIFAVIGIDKPRNQANVTLDAINLLKYQTALHEFHKSGKCTRPEHAYTCYETEIALFRGKLPLGTFTFRSERQPQLVYDERFTQQGILRLDFFWAHCTDNPVYTSDGFSKGFNGAMGGTAALTSMYPRREQSINS